MKVSQSLYTKGLTIYLFHHYIQKKESLIDYSTKLSNKKGSYLLSRIALQYHRRKWA